MRKYKTKEVYKGIEASALGGGKNAEILLEKLIDLDDKPLLYKFLKKFNKTCYDLSFVAKISDKSVRDRIINLVLDDVWNSVNDMFDRKNAVSADFVEDIRNRFMATIKRQLKKDNY